VSSDDGDEGGSEAEEAAGAGTRARRLPRRRDAQFGVRPLPRLTVLLPATPPPPAPQEEELQLELLLEVAEALVDY
jgi:hypothetical protein